MHCIVSYCIEQQINTENPKKKIPKNVSLGQKCVIDFSFNSEKSM